MGTPIRVDKFEVMVGYTGLVHLGIAAFFGNFLIAVRAYAYMRHYGDEGLKERTRLRAIFKGGTRHDALQARVDVGEARDMLRLDQLVGRGDVDLEVDHRLDVQAGRRRVVLGQPEHVVQAVVAVEPRDLVQGRIPQMNVRVNDRQVWHGADHIRRAAPREGS